VVRTRNPVPEAKVAFGQPPLRSEFERRAL
jgi:hypothetical protein